MKQNLTNLKHILNILFFWFALTTCAFAVDGDLDLTFNAGLTEFGDFNRSVANVVAVQPDGRILVDRVFGIEQFTDGFFRYKRQHCQKKCGERFGHLKISPFHSPGQNRFSVK